MNRKIRSIFDLLNLKQSGGLAQIPIILGLLIMAIAVPIATKLVEQS